jgi:hypothetical protein
MNYITIYEFEPSIISIAFALVPIGIIIIGFLGLRYIKKNGFRKDAYIVPLPYNQNTMNMIAKFFVFCFIVFGFMALIGLAFHAWTSDNQEQEVHDQLKNKTFQILETKNNTIKPEINESLEFDNRIEIEGSEFVFPYFLQISGVNRINNDLLNQIELNSIFRISFIELSNMNMILKIEIKATNANSGS